MDIKSLLHHVDMVYTAIHPHGKKEYHAILSEYMDRMGFRRNQKLDVVFDNIVYKTSFTVPDKYKPSMKFALEREMLENWIVQRYGIDIYNTLLQHSNSTNHSHDKSVQHA
jgi:hypothetical protein